jgi:hypothetical protein
LSENQNQNFNSSGIPSTNSANPLNENAGSPLVDNSPLAVKKAAPKNVEAKPAENKVVKLLEKNHLGMTLPEMAGGPRQLKRIRTLRPILAEAIKIGLVMPVSQRAGHTVYRLVKNLGPR